MNDEQNGKQTTQSELLDQTVELGSGLVHTHYGSIYILTIIGQIEGHQVLPETVKTTKYEHLMPLLAQIEESEQVDGLLLLNTVGGDIVMKSGTVLDFI